MGFCCLVRFIADWVAYGLLSMHFDGYRLADVGTVIALFSVRSCGCRALAVASWN